MSDVKKAYLTKLVVGTAIDRLIENGKDDAAKSVKDARMALSSITDILTNDEKTMLEKKLRELLGSDVPDIVKLAAFMLDEQIERSNDDSIQKYEDVLQTAWEMLVVNIELTDWEDRNVTSELYDAILKCV